MPNGSLAWGVGIGGPTVAGGLAVEEAADGDASGDASGDGEGDTADADRAGGVRSTGGEVIGVTLVHPARKTVAAPRSRARPRIG